MENLEVINLLKDAFELKRQTKYKQAMELLYKALSLHPDNVEILTQVAQLHILLDNPSSACGIYEQLLAKKPDDVFVFEQLVSFYLSVFNYEKAKILIEKFVLSYPSEKVYAVYLQTLNEMRLFEKSMTFYEEKDLGTYHSELLNRCYAIALCYQKRYSEAVDILKIEVEKSPHDVELRFYYAQALYLSGNENDAFDIISPFLNDSINPKIYNLAGEIELGKEKFESAIALFLKSVKLKQNGLYFYNLATAYFLNGQLDEAKNSYLQAISFSPEVEEYRYALAYLFYKQQNLKKSKQIIEEVLKRTPDFRAARILYCNILFDENRFFCAEKELKKCEFEASEDEEYLSLLAKVYRALYKNESAREVYEKLLEIKPESMDYRFELARICFDMMKYERAAQIIVSIISARPNYVHAYILASKIYIKMFDFENVLKMTDKILQLDLNNEEAFYLKSLAQISMEKADDAIETAKCLLTYNPHKSEAYALLGACYTEKNDLEVALKYYEEAISLDSKKADYFLNASVLLEKLGRNKDALRYLNIARAMNSENKEINSRLIDLYVAEKHYKQALILLQAQYSYVKDAEIKKCLKSQIDEITNLYKKSVNPVSFLIWKLLKI